MNKRLLIILLFVGMAVSCALASKKKPNTQGVLCVWPDPIDFHLDDDDWKVCFEIDHKSSTGYKPICLTVAELRHLILSRQFAN